MVIGIVLLIALLNAYIMVRIVQALNFMIIIVGSPFQKKTATKILELVNE